ncbi:trypsin-like serine protease [Pyxidicoccus trucidator]|uniref:trypsin-like serine protease n=1 Tax=Pyxidicoccus trucidator TaxID=2709662 RepID=UPI0013DA6B23|nr:trypsin-like serine protease [Pyxidicoccus trucidator]
MSSGLVVRRWAAAGVMSLVVGCGPEVVEEKHPQEPVASSAQEIVGGTNTTIAANPWQVSLQSSSGSHFCGGSVLNANWILTAQHCVNSGGSISKPGRVLAGSTTRNGTGQARTVAEVVVYPGYVTPELGKDVALLRLSTPLDLSGANVKAIGMVTAADASSGTTNVGVVSRVTGWGALSSGGSSPTTLQTVDVNLISNTSAQSSYPDETITADQLGAAAPGKDSCQGDSGGPLTVLKGSTRVLAGVVSWGYGCADSRYPGMYSRVSSFESWITSKISGTPPPTTTLLSRTGLSGASGSFQHFAITVPAGTTSLTVTQTGGTGDADLYVRSGSQPTTTTYNCRPYLSGNAETCSFANPTAGTWYVSVRGYTSFTGVSLTATVP